MTFDHRARREALRAALRERGLDALLVTDLTNVRYLSGFTGSNGGLLIDARGEEQSRIATDGRYTTQVAEQAPDLVVLNARGVATALVAHAAKHKTHRLGVEGHVVTLQQHRALVSAAGHAADQAAFVAPDLVPVVGVVELLRVVKDPHEVEALRKAAEIGDKALAELLGKDGVRPGRTELEVARELESLMLDFGSEGASFETIVAAGANSAMPHHRPTGAVLAEGDFVKIDFGATWLGYHSDMTRTYVLGEPAAWQREVYELVLAAQTAGREALKPGVELKSVDAAARDVIDAAGHKDHFDHGLGHAVGLDIHESPALSKLSEGLVPVGAVLTVEPGVYLPGKGGVRIEDTLVVGESENQLLTRTDKALTILGS
ncbi:peptidase M24 [Segniliparus rotundus DSM 44985]|uniref:Peptidase M24 n=1 Tax=Segniliparus rotundus (strain ATCC BAA-972 / CDC 1076 / CIP 108378 / DSM 44985 / JCM 13578) TaxID=640132 RepID=D6ZAN5_SEGRD|nr:aminopeptidase P family protein [Segniliparus rotundus]ADG98771.1 peptidase M24 [Segniliparus rotundus DSM 44985]